MNRLMLSLLVPAALVASMFVTGCDSNGNNTVDLQTVTVNDVPADPPTGRDPNTGQPIGTTGKFTFYSLRENRIILSDEVDRSDSASTKWDIAFHSTTILVNGNGIGGGQGGAQVLTSAFENVAEAPSSGYTASSIGLESGGATAWGTYDAGSMTVFPLADHTLLIKTGDGKSYAKVKILSYYKGAPTVPDPFQDSERYFTFEYVLQTSGRRFQ
jgi:hypothetical protein